MTNARNLKVEVSVRGPRGGEYAWGIIDVATGAFVVQADGEALEFATASSAHAFIEGYEFALREES